MRSNNRSIHSDDYDYNSRNPGIGEGGAKGEGRMYGILIEYYVNLYCS